jgi:hypothetical protein
VDVVFWCGPVTAKNLERVPWARPTRVVVVGKGAGGSVSSSAFGELAAELGPRPLDALAKRNGFSLDSVDKVSLLGFSAAHGLMNPILAVPEHRERISAVGAFDAYYTSQNGPPKPGYLAMAERACAGHSLMVVTTSDTAGPNYPSGSEAFGRLAKNLDLGPGQMPEGIQLPPPATLKGRGGFVWADYRDAFKHVEHATKLAPAWSGKFLSPALARGDARSPSDGTGPFLFAVALLGFAWLIT